MTQKAATPSFTVIHEAWYWDAVRRHRHDAVPEIMIGWYHDDGSIKWYEFAIRWIDLQNQPSPRVEIFDEAWPAFIDPTMGTLFTWLAQHPNRPTPDQVKAALTDLGFEDCTPRVPRGQETEDA